MTKEAAKLRDRMVNPWSPVRITPSPRKAHCVAGICPTIATQLQIEVQYA